MMKCFREEIANFNYADDRKPRPGYLYYLAHPLTHGGASEECNRQDAARIEKILLGHGIQVINPILLPLGQPGETLQADEATAREQCKYLLRACDGIILSPSWGSSCGCRKEWIMARTLKMPIYEILPGGIYDDARG